MYPNAGAMRAANNPVIALTDRVVMKFEMQAYSSGVPVGSLCRKNQTKPTTLSIVHTAVFISRK